MSEGLGEQKNAAAFKGRSGMARIFKAAGYSMAGFRAAYKGEAAFRQLVWLAAILLPIALYLDVTSAERALLIAVVLLSLVVELLNSAIEATVDRISLELHPLSKQAKDMGSAAQFVSLTLIVVTWGLVLL